LPEWIWEALEMSRQMALYITLVVTLGLLGLSSVYASAPEGVSVSISGPSEGWVNEDLSYSASGDYSLDSEIQEEVDEGEATVEEEYSWSYGPAELVGGDAQSPSITIRYAYEHGGAYHTVSVTYTVTVTYKDGTSDGGSASDSIEVKVKRMTISVGSSKPAICAGGDPSGPHQATITATVTDGFDGIPGETVSFSADHDYNQKEPSFNPENQTTDENGEAQTTLTSGDGVVTGEVKATCGQQHDEETVSFEEPEKEISFEDPITGEPVYWLYADGQSQCKVILSMTYGGVAVAGHDVAWTFKFWDAETDPSMDPEPTPEYEGTGEPPYGWVSPTGGQTDQEGLADTIYTVGTVGGSIAFIATDNSVYVKEQAGSQARGVPIAANPGWKATSKQRGLGDEGGDIPVEIIGVWWMTAGYVEVEEWQSHIRVNNEMLYPMVKLKPAVENGTVPDTTEIHIWSGATDTDGFYMELVKVAGPDAEGAYKYWPAENEEPRIGPSTDSNQHIIGVSHTSNDVDEYTTHDNHDATDSNAIVFGHNRGNGRWYELEDENTLWANLEYLKCAGIEKVYVESTEDTEYWDVIAAKNQADLLYFSGHGSAATGRIWREPQLPTPVNYSDIGVSNWSVDLDVFVIAACAVLNIADKTGHDINVGLGWANSCVRSGPLDSLCGYHDSAPGDAGGVPQQIAQQFSARFNGYNPAYAWGGGNNAVVNTYWCVITASTYTWHAQDPETGEWIDRAESY